MSYRTILVNLNIDGPVAPLMDYAINLAARFNSHLIGFAAAVPSAPMAWPEGMMTDGEMAHEREEIELRIKNLRREFESHAGTNVSREWRDGVANPTRLIIEMSRVADLIVTGCEDDLTLGHPERFINLGNLVLQAGRPVLVAAKGAKRILTNTAVIAWKDTREARRAVVDALPLLCQASEVVVVTVDRGADMLTQESIDDVCAFLHRHGVTARSEIIKDRHESESLLRFARQMGAELVVSGAYGHSRVRELVFGGVTRSLLAEDSFSRFLSS
ncbi:universal stress protein [Phyllobacterium sp. LjRoot231]|uniref:universal stress protein n=1 Tax=Phyllobacterium sp. LjRoot231 TaxID=3342289 RepID=UPI003ED0885F